MDNTPTTREVYARATEIATTRYPEGCRSATVLGRIVREAIGELCRPSEEQR